MLPAFAAFVPIGISLLVQSSRKIPAAGPTWRRWAPSVTLLGILLLALSSYAAIWRADPICYREADLNMKGRVALDRQIGQWIMKLPPNSTLLMYLGGTSALSSRMAFRCAEPSTKAIIAYGSSPRIPKACGARAR